MTFIDSLLKVIIESSILTVEDFNVLGKYGCYTVSINMIVILSGSQPVSQSTKKLTKKPTIFRTSNGIMGGKHIEFLLIL